MNQDDFAKAPEAKPAPKCAACGADGAIPELFNWGDVQGARCCRKCWLELSCDEQMARILARRADRANTDAALEHQRALNQGWEFPCDADCHRCGQTARVTGKNNLYILPSNKLAALCSACWDAVSDDWDGSKPDPYEAHRVRYELLESQRYIDSWLPAAEARARNIAALRLELDTPTSARRAALNRKFGPRPGIDDWTVGEDEP